MSNLPQGFYVDSLFCFPVGPSGAQIFYYLPTTPNIEKMGEQVKASLLSSDTGAVLSLQILWETDSETIEKAKKAIIKRYPDLKKISLNVANLSDVTAILKIGDQENILHSIGPKKTSGPNLFKVVFQDTLLVSEKEAVLKVFKDRASNILIITYEGSLNLTETVEVEINTDLVKVLQLLSPKMIEKKGKGLFGKKKMTLTPIPTLTECKESLEKAMEQGDFSIIQKSSANISPKKQASVEQELLNDVGKMLHEELEELGKDAQYVSSYIVKKGKSEPEMMNFNVSYSYDLAKTITTNGDLVQFSSTSISEPLR